MTSTGDFAGTTGHELELAGIEQVLVGRAAGVDQAVEAGQLETAFLLAAPDPVAVYLASLGSVESRRTMTGSLDRLASLLTGRPGTTATEIPWHRLRPEHTTAIRAQLLAAYAPSTSRKMLSALSGVLKQCWRLKLMERDDYDRTVAWGSVDGSTLTGADAGRHVDAGELRALFTSCAADPRPTGARDAAALAVLFGAGLRRAECTALDLDDCRQASGEREVDGKGERARLGYCGTSVRAVEDWIAVRGDESGPLLLAVNKGGRIDPARSRLSTSALCGIVQRRAAAAGIAKFSPQTAAVPSPANSSTPAPTWPPPATHGPRPRQHHHHLGPPTADRPRPKPAPPA
jgi:integrase